MKDGESEAKLAVHGFEDMLHKDFIAGIKEVGQAVEGLPHLLGDCRNLSADIATLEAWAVVFEHPAALPDLVKTNVTHNLIKMTRDLKKAKSEWAAEEYYQFGTTLGEMLVIATQPLAMEF